MGLLHGLGDGGIRAGVQHFVKLQYWCGFPDLFAL